MAIDTKTNNMKKTQQYTLMLMMLLGYTQVFAGKTAAETTQSAAEKLNSDGENDLKIFSTIMQSMSSEKDGLNKSEVFLPSTNLLEVINTLVKDALTVVEVKTPITLSGIVSKIPIFGQFINQGSSKTDSTVNHGLFSLHSNLLPTLLSALIVVSPNTRALVIQSLLEFKKHNADSLKNIKSEIQAIFSQMNSELAQNNIQQGHGNDTVTLKNQIDMLGVILQCDSQEEIKEKRRTFGLCKKWSDRELLIFDIMTLYCQPSLAKNRDIVNGIEDGVQKLKSCTPILLLLKHLPNLDTIFSEKTKKIILSELVKAEISLTADQSSALFKNLLEKQSWCKEEQDFFSRFCSDSSKHVEIQDAIFEFVRSKLKSNVKSSETPDKNSPFKCMKRALESTECKRGSMLQGMLGLFGLVNSESLDKKEAQSTIDFLSHLNTAAYPLMKKNIYDRLLSLKNSWNKFSQQEKEIVASFQDNLRSNMSHEEFSQFIPNLFEHNRSKDASRMRISLLSGITFFKTIPVDNRLSQQKIESNFKLFLKDNPEGLRYLIADLLKSKTEMSENMLNGLLAAVKERNDSIVNKMMAWLVFQHNPVVPQDIAKNLLCLCQDIANDIETSANCPFENFDKKRIIETALNVGRDDFKEIGFTDEERKEFFLSLFKFFKKNPNIEVSSEKKNWVHVEVLLEDAKAGTHVNLNESIVEMIKMTLTDPDSDNQEILYDFFHSIPSSLVLQYVDRLIGQEWENTLPEKWDVLKLCLDVWSRSPEQRKALQEKISLLLVKNGQTIGAQESQNLFQSLFNQSLQISDPSLEKKVCDFFFQPKFQEIQENTFASFLNECPTISERLMNTILASFNQAKSENVSQQPSSHPYSLQDMIAFVALSQGVVPEHLDASMAEVLDLSSSVDHELRVKAWCCLVDMFVTRDCNADAMVALCGRDPVTKDISANRLRALIDGLKSDEFYQSLKKCVIKNTSLETKKMFFEASIHRLDFDIDQKLQIIFPEIHDYDANTFSNFWKQMNQNTEHKHAVLSLEKVSALLANMSNNGSVSEVADDQKIDAVLLNNLTDDQKMCIYISAFERSDRPNNASWIKHLSDFIAQLQPADSAKFIASFHQGGFALSEEEAQIFSNLILAQPDLNLPELVSVIDSVMRSNSNLKPIFLGSLLEKFNFVQQGKSSNFFGLFYNEFLSGKNIDDIATLFPDQLSDHLKEKLAISHPAFRNRYPNHHFSAVSNCATYKCNMLYRFMTEAFVSNYSANNFQASLFLTPSEICVLYKEIHKFAVQNNRGDAYSDFIREEYNFSVNNPLVSDKAQKEIADLYFTDATKSLSEEDKIQWVNRQVMSESTKVFLIHKAMFQDRAMPLKDEDYHTALAPISLNGLIAWTKLREVEDYYLFISQKFPNTMLSKVKEEAYALDSLKKTSVYDMVKNEVFSNGEKVCAEGLEKALNFEAGYCDDIYIQEMVKLERAIASYVEPEAPQLISVPFINNNFVAKNWNFPEYQNALGQDFNKLLQNEPHLSCRFLRGADSSETIQNVFKLKSVLEAFNPNGLEEWTRNEIASWNNLKGYSDLIITPNNQITEFHKMHALLFWGHSLDRANYTQIDVERMALHWIKNMITGNNKVNERSDFVANMNQMQKRAFILSQFIDQAVGRVALQTSLQDAEKFLREHGFIAAGQQMREEGVQSLKQVNRRKTYQQEKLLEWCISQGIFQGGDFLMNLPADRLLVRDSRPGATNLVPHPFLFINDAAEEKSRDQKISTLLRNFVLIDRASPHSNALLNTGDTLLGELIGQNIYVRSSLADIDTEPFVNNAAINPAPALNLVPSNNSSNSTSLRRHRSI
jgi:hypothetical protein